MKLALARCAWASVTVATLGACASLDTHVEQTIRSELPRLVGPAIDYDVKVSGARVSGDIADVRNVRVIGTRINRPKSPVIDHLEVDMSNVIVDRKEKKLTSMSGASAEARVLAADIAAFVDAKPGLDNVEVTLHPPYELTVTARPSIAGFMLPRQTLVKMRGRLVVNASQLDLEIVDLRAAGYPVGNIPKFILEKAINPIVDLTALPLASRVSSVKVTDDAVVMVATGGGTSLNASR